MDKSSVFSKTGKGLLQLKHKSHPLPQTLFCVLSQIDGRTTLADVAAKIGMREAELYRAVKGLTDDGFIREVASSVVAVAPFTVGGRALPTSEVDLDFTRTLGGPSSPHKPKA